MSSNSSQSVRLRSYGKRLISPGRPRITNNNHQSFGGKKKPTNINKVINDLLSDRKERGLIQVGRDYQAKIPIMIPKEERNVQAEDEKALLLWRPNDKISDDEIEHYVSVATDKYQYSEEQALGVLYWNGHDVTKAIEDLENFTPD